MSTLTIRQLDPRTHARLRARAAQNGRSVESEVRGILDASVATPGENLLLAVQVAFSDVDVDLQLPERTDRPRPVEFA